MRKSRVLESDDDAESRDTTKGSRSRLNAPSIESEARSDDSPGPPSATSTPPVTPGIRPVEQLDSYRPPHTQHFVGDGASIGVTSRFPERDHLLALRVSRTGHLFAVITTTSLTIWQTKVADSFSQF